MLTPEEVRVRHEQRERRCWQSEQNAKRRERYASDPVYRQQLRDKNRERYREDKTTGDPARFRETCLDNLSKIGWTGKERAVRADKQREYVVGRVYTIADVAWLLNRTLVVIHRWIGEQGIFPAPVLHDVRGIGYYAQPEVHAFVRIMGEHQLINQHYRLDHEKTYKRLKSAAFSRNPNLVETWIAQHSGVISKNRSSAA